MLDSYQHLVIIDIEHTCTADGSIVADEREIIEIGAVIVDSQNFEPVATFGRFVKPVQHPILDDFCVTLTGIQRADVASGEGFKEVLNAFNQWRKPYRDYLLCSWGGYDQVQLDLDCRYHALAHVGLAQQGAHHRALSDAQNIARLLPFIFLKDK